MDTEKTLKKLKRFKTCSYIIERLMLFFTVLLFIMVLWLILPFSDSSNERLSEAGFVFYGQIMVATFIGYLIFIQITKILEESIEERTVFLPGHAKRLRVVAVLLIALMLFAFGCSLLVDALSNNQAPIVFNLYVDGCGFPSYREWLMALDVDSHYSSGTYVAKLNLLPALIAIFVWALSYVFEYGTALQREVDLTF